MNNENVCANCLLKIQRSKNKHAIYCSLKCKKKKAAERHNKKYPSRNMWLRIVVIKILGGKCKKCQLIEKLEIDHIVPTSKGGENEIKNLQILCRKHHKEKTMSETRQNSS